MSVIGGVIIGFLVWFFLRVVLFGIYTVDQNERAVKTSFGRAERLPGNKTTLDDPIAAFLQPEERARYTYPQVRVIPPGGPYLKMPWQRVYKVSIATMTENMAKDFEDPMANSGGTRLDAVTKDQLNTGLTGQIRYRVSESNLYAFLFGIKKPFVHVTAYFVSVLRQKIANFEAKQSKPATGDAAAQTALSAIPGAEMIGVSINDLRKNLRDLNEYMDQECRSAQARYGVQLEASLITGIDPPPEVESALAAINTAHNQVSSDISLAQASADQKIEQSKRAVEIETLKAQAEIEPIRLQAAELARLYQQGSGVLQAYLRNMRLKLFEKTQDIYMAAQRGEAQS
ncbi:MAG: SPFH domain-containing protein [Bryobacteraceae bacterium]|jgi:regulator of protease activity HflC (stomatin/prohibitin superfamily)